MRQKLPPIRESAEELHQRMKYETDSKKRHRLHARYLVASGQARHRHKAARLLGVPRHSVAAWFAAYAAGGVDQALHYQRSTPPVHRRMTDTALTAWPEKLQEPHGFVSSAQIRGWWAEAHQVTLAYSSVQALVRYKLQATPKRPRPSQAKKVPQR